MNSASKYTKLLDSVPMGANQTVASRMSEEIFGVESRSACNELKDWNSLLKAYVITKDSNLLAKSNEYLSVWVARYSPDVSNVKIQIPLDQRLFGQVFALFPDVWLQMPLKSQQDTFKLVNTVLQAEKVFWEKHKPQGNRYSYSNFTRITGFGVLKLEGSVGAGRDFAASVLEFYQQVLSEVAEDGSSWDFRERDSVHYHVFNQIPWERTRRYLNDRSMPIPLDVTKKLDLSLKFGMPYIKGATTHLEFVNSKHPRDATIHMDKIGKPFDLESFVVKELLSILENK